MGMYPGTRRRTTGTQDPSCSTPSSLTKAAKDAFEVAVVSLPASLQPLITHFGHKIIMARCK